MNPLMHVTRYPASGEVLSQNITLGNIWLLGIPSLYRKRKNTRYKTPKFGEILYRQIAGALAKRIVNYAKEGEAAYQGKDAGFIKFGSRVDVFLPLGTPITVELGQKVKGAKTPIALLKSTDA